MSERFSHILSMVSDLERLTKQGADSAASVRRDREILERERAAFEQERRFERAMRAVRENKW